MLRVLIIDDELKIRLMIEEIVSAYCKGARVIGLAGSVSEGLAKIESLNPDLVLLDVKMDDGTGFDLLEQINKINFRVIFITAFQEFAIKAIKFSALDYIMKPVDPEELISAVGNAQKEIDQHQDEQLTQLKENLKNNGQAEKKILLKTADCIHMIPISEIYYCEADSGYTRFYIKNSCEILISRPLVDYEELFEEYGFFRVHKSYLVNLGLVQRFEREDGGYLVMDRDLKIPVASRKRDQLMQLLERIAQ
ncbi:MAG: LytTR family DNA-binding domain-containing protein [Bacteroidota bacterium]